MHCEVEESVRTHTGSVSLGKNDTTGQGTCGGNQCPDIIIVLRNTYYIQTNIAIFHIVYTQWTIVGSLVKKTVLVNVHHDICEIATLNHLVCLYIQILFDK